IYVRMLGPFAETLAMSEDGGLSFVPSVSVPGKLTAFLKLASGTLLIGGTAGTSALGYRSNDHARSFEPWQGVPHIQALAERNGRLYAATDNFIDGYAVAVSDDEGAHFRSLTGFAQVQAVKGCAVDLCAERCSYYAGIGLWPEAACEAESAAPDAGVPATDPSLAGSSGQAGSHAGAAGGGACSLFDAGLSAAHTGKLLLLAS